MSEEMRKRLDSLLEETELMLDSVLGWLGTKHKPSAEFDQENWI
jgi:hypothetical protein